MHLGHDRDMKGAIKAGASAWNKGLSGVRYWLNSNGLLRGFKNPPNLLLAE